MREHHLELTYLDHAATTPLFDESFDAMLPYLRDSFANPSSSYASARLVRRALDDAREELAALFGCHPDELVFTSGGTEADNLALFGAVAARQGKVVVSAGEHKAVLVPGSLLGAAVAALDERAVVDLDELTRLVDRSTVLVSVMAVNNEVGVIEPMAKVCEIVRQAAPEALVHCDAVQGFCFLDPVALTAPCDLVSYSAHKFGGPKGVGALVVRRGATERHRATHVGGEQERGRRAGTENVAGVIGMAAAARTWSAQRALLVARIGALRDELADGIVASWPGARETVVRSLRVAGNCHVLLPGVENEELLMVLDEGGVCASAGSACMSGAIEQSHVLAAMGISSEVAKSAVRFSLGWTTTRTDVERALTVLKGARERLVAP